MLVHEWGDELHLLSAVPDWWLGDGKEIRVERAPTHFGVLSLTVRGKAEGVAIDFEPPKRTAPARIVLHLPKSRPLVGRLPDVEVVARSDQKQRWDFPTIVETYRVIHYADGKTQAVPLVNGRTCGQWNWQPTTDDVVATLEGATWHMNVLAASLRDAPITRITFRDLGTASAPVLAAVTLELP